MKRTPAKSGKATRAAEHAADGELEASDKTPKESNDKISEETPKKPVRAKKTPTKRTPARKTPARKTPAKKTTAADGDLPAEEDGVSNTLQQENGKPKRKYVRKRPVQEVEPVREPPCKEAEGEPEEEIQPGGRRRRGAAKA